MKNLTKDTANKYKNSHWYAYLDGYPLDPKSYYLITKPALCLSGRNLCAIYTQGFHTQPEDFSPKLKTAIANALATGAPQSNNDDVQIVVLKTIR